ncbi:MAG: hypothetical protein ABIJ34_00595 [archaeon]
MNKKGDAYEILWNTIIRLPYIALIFIIFVYMYSNLIDTALDSHKINDQITLQRIIYSPDALAYKDPQTNRVFPGIIDVTKATQESFEKAFLIGEGNNIAAKIELTTLADNDIRELYVNKIWYERWSPLTNFDQYDKSIIRRPVLIRNKGILFPGIIKIHVISKNE